MNKERTKDELYHHLMEAAKMAKELGSKEVFEAITEVKLKVIRTIDFDMQNYYPDQRT